MRISQLNSWRRFSDMLSKFLKGKIKGSIGLFLEQYFKKRSRKLKDQKPKKNIFSSHFRLPNGGTKKFETHVQSLAECFIRFNFSNHVQLYLEKYCPALVHSKKLTLHLTHAYINVIYKFIFCGLI